MKRSKGVVAMWGQASAAVALATALLSPHLAFARAPEPRKPIEIERFMGRWHEIIRTPNARQKDCFAAYQTWSRVGDAHFNIDQVCHKGSESGPAKRVKTKARVIDRATNAKFEASFFGGLIRKDYWVIDHDEAYTWMIASTADGQFVSLLARTPGLPTAIRSSLKARIRELGFTSNQLEEVR